MPTLARSLRRLKPHRVSRLQSRSKTALPRLDAATVRARAKLLLDTTVYVDVLKGRGDSLLDAALGACDLWHSAVAIGELARGLGADDPGRKGYRLDSRWTMVLVDRMPSHKVLQPDAEAFELAGTASGILKRILGLDRSALARC